VPDTFALTYTVPTDQNGDAVVRIPAKPTASPQHVNVQAKDLATGNFVRGIFVIYQFLPSGANQLQVVPDTVTITGPDTLTCSAGVASTFYVFGGQPPYTISNSVPQFLRLGQTLVANSGGGFTLSTLGGCVTPATIAISDSAGHTATITLNNNPGTQPPNAITAPIPIVTTPAASAIPTLACGANTNIVATGGGTITTQGTTQTPKPATSLFVGVDRPDIITALPSTVAPGEPITITRTTSISTVNPPNSNVSVPVNVLISDGAQTLTVPVRVANTCPAVP
jgi:hypothetical protein